MTNEQQPFQPGDIIDFCGEHYTVLQNYGRSGMVQDAGGDLINPFYWKFDGAECRLVNSR
jgi:hypothetical protein